MTSSNQEPIMTLIDMESETNRKTSYEEYLKYQKSGNYCLFKGNDTYETVEEYFASSKSAIQPSDLDDYLVLGKRAELPDAESIFDSLCETLERDEDLHSVELDWGIFDNLDKNGFIEAITPWLEKQKAAKFYWTHYEVDIRKEKEAYFKKKER